MALLAAIVAAVGLLPGFSPAGTGPQGGALLSGTFPGTQRPGLVYLPPGFDTARRYPVIYLLHGMPGSPSEYSDGVGLAGFADNEIVAGRLAPFIAVIPAAGPNRDYNGEWAGPLETAFVDQVVPWVDAHLPTIATRSGRVLAGLSAGGYGAVDIGIRHSRLFGSIASWSGYFRPLNDGPFKGAPPDVLRANDPRRTVAADAPWLLRRHTRFFLSSGPAHSHWFSPTETSDYARELRRLGLPVQTFYYGQPQGEWRAQVDAGLAWAFPA